jgi:peptidoglycan/LPS O-acetylase OafA/YrhL
LLTDRKGPHYYATFYSRRSLRIFPIYFLVIGGLFIVGLLAGKRVADWSFFATYTQNWLYALSDTWDDDGNIHFPWAASHTWSLAIEEQFYLLWPLAVRNMSTRNLTRLALLFIAIGPLSRYTAIAFTHRWWTAYTPLFAQIDMLAHGALGAIVYSEDLLSNVRLEVVAKLGLAVGAVILFYGVEHNYALPTEMLLSKKGQIIFTALGPFYLSLLVLAMAGGPLTRVLELRPIRYCGRISYGLYLYHWPILVLAERSFGQGPATAIFVLVITFILSAASYRFLERPILEAKDRIFPRKIES